MPRKPKIVSLITSTLNEHKASNIVDINVKEKTPFADYYILATALNTRHANALKEEVIEALEKAKFDVGHVEGKDGSKWILIDAHEVIINIFTEDERNRLSLEEILAN